MTIETKYKIGDKIRTTIDSSKVGGVIKELRVYIGKDHEPVITYAGMAGWKYKGQKYYKEFICSENELEFWPSENQETDGQ